MSYLVLIKKIWVVYVVLDWYWYETHSILAEFYEIFSTRFSWYWICLVFYLFKFFCFLSNLFMIHCHWLFYHADDSEFTIWSGGTVSNAAINASISMNTCTLSLNGFQTGPITLHLALFSGLCTRASCSALPIWYHGWGKFQWLEWKCRLFFLIILSLVCDFCKLFCLCRWKHMGTFCTLQNVQLSVLRDLQSFDTIDFLGWLGLCTIF